MISAAFAALALVCGLSSSNKDDVSFNDASIEFEGDVLDWRLIDSVVGGLPRLAVTVRSAERGRELHVFDIQTTAIPRPAQSVVPILDDVLALGFAEVRAEPGKELILLTRSGAWSYSITKSGYKDNVERLVELDLVYDFPDPRALPFWEYDLPVLASGVQPVLLPGKDGFSTWAPAEIASGFELSATFGSIDNEAEEGKNLVSARAAENGDARDDGEVSVSVGSGRRSSLFLDSSPDGSLLRGERSYRAPALVDVNGDGFADIVRALKDGVHVHLWDNGYDATPTRIEAPPAYLLEEPDDDYLKDSTWHLADLDGDGDSDLIVHRHEDPDGFENGQHRLQLLLNDGKRLLPDSPHQLLRFEAAEIGFEVSDVDGDGNVDLSLREFKLPSLLETVTGLEFTLTHLLYLGQSGGRFDKRPAFKQSESFDESTVDLAIAKRHHKLEADGDGIADLVEVDIHGRIAIRRVSRKSSFFGGDKWRLDESPWKRFDAHAGTLSLHVTDINRDGLLDIVSKGTSVLTILLSNRRSQ